MNLSGKRPRSPGDADYLMMIVDGNSRFYWPNVLRKNYEVPIAFDFFCTYIDSQGPPSTVNCLRLDNANEFTKQEFVEQLDRHGIRRGYTPIDSSNYNVVAERSLTMTLDLAMASCLETLRLFDSVLLPPADREKSCLNVCDGLNMMARVDKPEKLSPYQIFLEIGSFPRLLTLLSPSSTTCNGR